MSRRRFDVLLSDDELALENGTPFIVWDYTKKRPYGWYASATDANNACCWLNATGGQLD